MAERVIKLKMYNNDKLDTLQKYGNIPSWFPKDPISTYL